LSLQCALEALRDRRAGHTLRSDTYGRAARAHAVQGRPQPWPCHAPLQAESDFADAALQVENILVLHSERLEGLEAHAPPLAMQS